MNKMSSIVHTVLSTELTNIPNFMQSKLGYTFNNTLCNGVTWLFVIWSILHFCYDKLINASLKQLGFIQYMRARLSNSLWLLATFAAFFPYYFMTRNEYNWFDMVNFRRPIIAQHEANKAVAQTAVCSFYLHMAFSQGVQMGSLHAFLKFGALTVVCTSAYILRYCEIPFTLTALIAMSGIFEELSKIFYSLFKHGNRFTNISINALYISSVLLFCLVYFAVIPLSFLIPLGMKLFSAGNTNNLLLITLFTSLLFWLNLVIYKSMPLNLIFHWLYHLRDDKEIDEDDEAEELPTRLGCPGQVIGCSLFPPRTDDGFIIAYLRAEAKRRQRRMLSKRKPKNRNMIIQTLKCMLVLKRKLNEKKAELQGVSTDEKAEQSSFIADGEFEDEEASSDETNEENANPIKRSPKMLQFGDDILQAAREETESNEPEIEIGNINDEEENNKLHENNSEEELSTITGDFRVEPLLDIEVDVEMEEHTCSSNAGKNVNVFDNVVKDATEDDRKNECTCKALLPPPDQDTEKRGHDGAGGGNGKIGKTLK